MPGNDASVLRKRHIPERTCVGCQSVRPKKELIRVVRTPESEIVVDPTGKKSGRGAYLCPDPECLRKAVKAKRLERSLERALSPEVLADLEARITAAAPGGGAPGPKAKE